MKIGFVSSYKIPAFLLIVVPVVALKEVASDPTADVSDKATDVINMFTLVTVMYNN